MRKRVGDFAFTDKLGSRSRNANHSERHSNESHNQAMAIEHDKCAIAVCPERVRTKWFQHKKQTTKETNAVIKHIFRR